MSDRFVVENIGQEGDKINKKTRWNLFNSEHKTTSDKYLNNYDNIEWIDYSKEEDDAEEDPVG